jgi:choline dehydrogenase-like flavoprotein
VSDVDAVIVGSGPAGATAAEVLTGAGWSVVMLEKGRNHLLALEAPFGPLGHVSNDEVKFLSRHFLGPDPFLEPRTFRHRESEGDRIFTGGVNNLPSTVGGGGFHADGKLPRFREVDFRARSELGPIDGADIVDWPIDYDELEPYYAAAERLLGVAGDHTGNPFAAWRSGPYPMPPGADMFCAVLTSEAATRHGMHPYRAPTGVNSVEYDGRPACNNCGFCAFFGCPIEAKGDPVALLRRALQTGRLEVRPESYVTDVLLDGSRRHARGVRYLDADGVEHELSAGAVVLGAGAFETPRLLLRSGIGNPDVVGRYLMFHFQTYVLGSFPFRLHGHRGRSVTHLMDDPIVPDDAAVAAARDADLPYFRGGIVEHGSGGHPVLEAIHLPPGPDHTALMLESPLRDHMVAFTMQGEDLPQPTNRIDLDPTVRDVWGSPAGRVTFTPHRHEAACAEHWAPRLEAVLLDAGADETFWITSPPLEGAARRFARDPTPISRHIMGTARMGTDPRASVCDPWQRLHDVENVLVADSSVFPTSTGYGPTLTIAALALRAARGLAGLDPLRSTRPPAPPAPPAG